MNLQEFKSIVTKNIEHYSGVQKENESSLLEAEQRLGHNLPDSMKWLLSEYGYAGATGVSSLESTIEDTLRCRKNISLPEGIVILNDMNDAGVVVIDMREKNQENEYSVIWTDSHIIQNFHETRSFGEDLDLYDSFADWSYSKLEELIEP